MWHSDERHFFHKRKFLGSFSICSHSGTVGIANGLRVVRSGVQVPVNTNKFSLLQNHPEVLWGPTSLLFNRYRVLPHLTQRLRMSGVIPLLPLYMTSCGGKGNCAFTVLKVLLTCNYWLIWREVPATKSTVLPLWTFQLHTLAPQTRQGTMMQRVMPMGLTPRKHNN